MKHALYKSTSLNILALAAAGCLALAQPAAAQSPPPSGPGLPGSGAYTCAIEGFAGVMLTGGTSEPVSPAVLAAVSDEYAEPNTYPSGNPIGMVQVYAVQISTGQTAFYKNFQYMNVLHYNKSNPSELAEVIDWSPAPSPYFGDKSDACAAAKAYEQSLAAQLQGSCNPMPISNCNCPAGPGLC